MKKLLFVATLLAIGIGIATTQPPSQPNTQSPEPLADPRALRSLIAGKPIVKPADESYGEFHGAAVRSPAIASLSQTSRVLGLSSGPGQKRIEVNLSVQKVFAFEGDTKMFDFDVSTGKWYPTPTGEFTIWAKVRSQKMEGGNPAIHTYYYLPNVPYVMFFSNGNIVKMRGFSLHGAYWHNNFGHPMSHGCINMKIDDAHVLYDWADPPVANAKAWSTLASKESPGTKVIIYGVTPKE